MRTYLWACLENVKRHTLIREAANLLSRKVGDEADVHRVATVSGQSADGLHGETDLANDLKRARRESVRLGDTKAAHVTGDEDDGNCSVSKATTGLTHHPAWRGCTQEEGRQDRCPR